MQDDNQETGKPVINKWLLVVMLVAVAVFMFGSIIYKYFIGF